MGRANGQRCLMGMLARQYLSMVKLDGWHCLTGMLDGWCPSMSKLDGWCIFRDTYLCPSLPMGAGSC